MLQTRSPALGARLPAPGAARRCRGPLTCLPIRHVAPPVHCSGRPARRAKSKAGSGGRNFHASLGRDVSRLFGAQMLAPFQLRSYRLQWPADLLTSCAFEMETLILGWYVLVATDSVLLLTLFGAL